MSKNSLLTENDFRKFTPNSQTFHYLEAFRKRIGIKKGDMNILDWGCGRGREVLWLRNEGYNAYGMDIDPKPIHNGIGLFRTNGYNDSTLRLASADGSTDFPGKYFHFTFSNQVFEHVQNIEAVAGEISRITIDGGLGFHVFPSHKRIVEGHLLMPFIHWLPKNVLRRVLIYFFVVLGIEPRWSEMSGKNLNTKANTYFRYSINSTFYRKYSEMERIFQKNGFQVRFETFDNPKYRKLLGTLADFSILKPTTNSFLLNFASVELLIQKK